MRRAAGRRRRRRARAADRDDGADAVRFSKAARAAAAPPQTVVVERLRRSSPITCARRGGPGRAGRARRRASRSFSRSFRGSASSDQLQVDAERGQVRATLSCRSRASVRPCASCTSTRRRASTTTCRIAAQRVLRRRLVGDVLQHADHAQRLSGRGRRDRVSRAANEASRQRRAVHRAVHARAPTALRTIALLARRDRLCRTAVAHGRRAAGRLRRGDGAGRAAQLCAQVVCSRAAWSMCRKRRADAGAHCTTTSART